MQTRTPSLLCILTAAMLLAPRVAHCENTATPGKLLQEPATLKCLGVRWLIAGDDNRNTRVQVQYRKAGEKAWRRALDLFRVETRAIRKPNRPPAGQTMFAGSVFDLAEGTEYEVKLTLKDPDGVVGAAERTLRMKTWSEPKLPAGGRKIDVRPGGLAAALRNARPGDTLLLHKGVYAGTFRPPSGAAGKPIALVGAGDGEAVLNGRGANNVVNGGDLHDVMLERLTFRNARWALAFNGAARITVRRCVVRDCEYGFVAQQRSHKQQRIFIADNVFRGRSTWPRTKGIEGRRGVQISGTGNVVCYNRVSHFADAIDTFSNYPCAAIDFYGNEISECTDDGVEMDYSEHNTRCFDNRLTNCYQGITVQPIHGGPVYVFRNAMYNVVVETFKMHNAPSGGLFFHNTSVKAGMPLVLWTSELVSNCMMRNNLFVGTTGNYAYETTAPMRGCDFDYDGFAGRWKQFLKWNRRRYNTLADAKSGAPVYRHAVRVRGEGLFASGVTPPADPKKQSEIRLNDLRLKAGSAAIDAGAVLPNVNDGFRGKAPDLGAYELGGELPHYGPR
jgi:hypothetical protein